MTTVACADGKSSARRSAGKRSSGADTLKCAALGAAVGFGTAFITNAILDTLDERDQRAALKAASESLETGQPTVVALPSSGATMTVTPVADTTTTEVVKEQAILVDKAQVAEVGGAFGVVGLPQRVRTRANVRSGPNVASAKVSQIEAGQVVHTFGKHETAQWYLVGLGVESDFYQEPMAIGYVSGDLLTAASGGDQAEINWIEGRQPPASAEVTKMKWVVKCQDMEFKLEKSDGTQTTSEVSSSCTGPTGIPVSA